MEDYSLDVEYLLENNVKFSYDYDKDDKPFIRVFIDTLYNPNWFDCKIVKHNCTYDEHCKVCLEYSNYIVNRLKMSIESFFLGLKEGFPLCCIISFCIMQLKKVKQLDDNYRYNKNMFGTLKNGTPYRYCSIHYRKSILKRNKNVNK